MSRKLATITKVKELLPIEGADRIEAATMTTNGWTCVIKKGEFVTGDFGIYFEIDSFLPKEERYGFLDGRSNKMMDGVEGYRLRTVKLRKQISQGLLMPLSIFPEITNPQEGDDVTRLLNIKLYEIPVKFSMGMRGARPAGKFPSFIRKTDQDRIQSLDEIQINARNNKTYEITEKLDGTSATYYYKNGRFGVCSRNLELQTSFGKNFLQRCIEWFRKKILWRHFEKQFGFPKSIYEEMAALHHLDKTLPELCKETGRNFAVQGEIVGTNISSNRLKLDTIDFYVFDIFDIDQQAYLDASERYEIATRLELRHVPILEQSYYLCFEETPIEQLIQLADGKSALSDQKREGIVYKQRGGEAWAVSFKVISNEYLLEHGL
jgi:RNA ligase (TIGR02306 family)